MEALKNWRVLFPEKQRAVLAGEDFDPRPGPGEVVGRTLCSVISTGSETGGYMDYFGGTAYPCPTGYAGVLEVLAAGEGVTEIKPGDRVFCQTHHQLYTRLPAGEALPVPPGLPPEHAALARFPAISMTTLIRTGIRPTEPVAVTGLGVVGLFCAQVLAHCGYPVYAADPSANRRATAEACGVLAAAPSLEALGRRGFGLGVECSGSDEGTLALLGAVRPGGEVALVGVPWRATSEVRANVIFRAVFTGYVTVYSGWEWSLPLHPAKFAPNSNFTSFATAMEWIRQKALRVEGVYALRSPRDCGEIYRELSLGQQEKTCVILDWRGMEA